MPQDLARHVLDAAIGAFQRTRTLGERALEQLHDDELGRTIDPEANSVATIVRHMAGNMRSRWTDFLTTDGEKPDRGRDDEFELDSSVAREDVMRWWNEGWRVTLEALGAIGPDDIRRTVTIRGESMSVLEAINRQLTHHAYHVGQIVLLAKHFRSTEWKSLSIPRRRREAGSETILPPPA